MNKKTQDFGQTDGEIAHVLQHLRYLGVSKKAELHIPQTWGEKISDSVAKVVGSWHFIITQSVLLVLWMIINLMALLIKPWDPYPFILLNLVLSFQAAFTAPIIMMSQNRQNSIDRQKAENDYNINVKAELEIMALHQKIDLLKEQEMKQLISIIEKLQQKLDSSIT
ncbi:MAG: DUF1003 domain-containing protein [Alphaproteobacteria bacterium]